MKIGLKELKGIIKESVIKHLNEIQLGAGEHFTPYDKKQRELNFSPFTKERSDTGNKNQTYLNNPRYYYAILLKQGYDQETARKMVSDYVGHDMW